MTSDLGCDSTRTDDFVTVLTQICCIGLFAIIRAILFPNIPPSAFFEQVQLNQLMDGVVRSPKWMGVQMEGLVRLAW